MFVFFIILRQKTKVKQMFAFSQKNFKIKSGINPLKNFLKSSSVFVLIAVAIAVSRSAKGEQE